MTFKQALTVVALITAAFLSVVGVITYSASERQKRAIEAYDRCLAAQVEVAKNVGVRSIPDCYLR